MTKAQAETMRKVKGYPITPEQVAVSGHTLESLADSVGLPELCKLFGWQGGTIHQAKEEMRSRLAYHGIVPVQSKGGVLCKIRFES